MLVIFRRTGQRRYGVEAQRPRFGAVQMITAPGYNELMPHDLMHLVVEAELGLKRGIFGQLEAGGHAGTFRTYVEPSSSKREGARRRRHSDHRSAKLIREGQDDCALSERATYICWQAWLARSKAKDRQRNAQEMRENAKHVRSISPSHESQALSEKKIERICQQLDELSSHWTGLKIGESLTVSWPDLSVR